MALWKTVKIFKKFIIAIIPTPFNILVHNYTSGVKWKNKIKALVIPQSPSLTRDMSKYNTILDINDDTGAISGDITYIESGGYISQPMFSNGFMYPIGKAFCVIGSSIDVYISILMTTDVASAPYPNQSTLTIALTINDFDTNVVLHSFPTMTVKSGVKTFLSKHLDFQDNNIRRLVIRGKASGSDFIYWGKFYLSPMQVWTESTPFIPYQSTGKQNMLTYKNISINSYTKIDFNVNLPICNDIVIVFRSLINTANGVTSYTQLEFGFDRSGFGVNIYLDGVLNQHMSAESWYDYITGHPHGDTAFDNIMIRIPNIINKPHTIRLSATAPSGYDYKLELPEVLIYYSDVTVKHLEDLNIIAFEGKD